MASSTVTNTTLMATAQDVLDVATLTAMTAYQVSAYDAIREFAPSDRFSSELIIDKSATWLGLAFTFIAQAAFPKYKKEIDTIFLALSTCNLVRRAIESTR